MALLTRDQFLAATDRKTKDLELAELGGTVRIAAISADTLFKFRDLSKRRSQGEDVELEIVGTILAGSIVDEQNKEMFTPADIPLLLKKSPTVVTAIFQQAMELNNLAPKQPATNEDAVPTVDPVEDARKNS